jgi:hypothetical protein
MAGPGSLLSSWRHTLALPGMQSSGLLVDVGLVYPDFHFLLLLHHRLVGGLTRLQNPVDDELLFAAGPPCCVEPRTALRLQLPFPPSTGVGFLSHSLRANVRLSDFIVLSVIYSARVLQDALGHAHARAQQGRVTGDRFWKHDSIPHPRPCRRFAGQIMRSTCGFRPEFRW